MPARYPGPMHRAARFGTWIAGPAVVLLLSKVHARYVADPPYDFTGSSRFSWAFAYAVVLGFAAYSFGLPDQTRSLRSGFVRAFGSVAAAAGAVSVVQLLVGDALLPRFVVFGTAVVLLPAYVVMVAMARAGLSRGEGRDRVVMVADDAELAQLQADIGFVPERPASVAACLTIEAAASSDGVSPLLDHFAGAGGTVLVLDHRAQLEPSIVSQAAQLHESGVRVRTLSDFYEQWLGKLPLGELQRTSLFFDISEVHRGSMYPRVKRLLDLGLGLLGAIVLVPVTPVVLVANTVGNRGPLLYRQERIGKGGGAFTILKFRTMSPSVAGSAESSWTAVDDVRITPVGRLLRVSHLDELPQVLNILRGDLSVVGPRPEQPHYVEDLSAKLPFYGMRHLVRPGLTGWAQVKYGYAGDERDALEKLQYEFFYLRNQSLTLDLRTIVRTLRSILGGAGAGR